MTSMDSDPWLSTVPVTADGSLDIFGGAHPIFGGASPLFFTDVTNTAQNALNRGKPVGAKPTRDFPAMDHFADRSGSDAPPSPPEPDDDDDTPFTKPAPLEGNALKVAADSFWCSAKPAEATIATGSPSRAPPPPYSVAIAGAGAVPPPLTPPRPVSSTGAWAATPSSIVKHVVQAGLETPQHPSAKSPTAAAPGGSSPTSSEGRGETTTMRPVLQPSRIDFTSIVVLEFKMGRRLRFKSNGIKVTAGQWVVVQLDSNGHVDMGQCVGVYSFAERGAIPRGCGFNEAGVVVRTADASDCERMNDALPKAEQQALQKAHQLIHFLHLPFQVIDAEFQFDLKAVIIFYSLAPQEYTSMVPNVSRLQRELSHSLKARVVLEQLVPVGGRT